MRLTDEQWAVLGPLIPLPEKKTTKRGCPRRPDREVLEGILWVLKTSAQWEERPKSYPAKSTCFDRFKVWNDRNVFPTLLEALYKQLADQRLLDLHESFVDGTFSAAKKGAWMSAGRLTPAGSVVESQAALASGRTR
ncbi:transposase [Deinococcus sp.]|uniref:transposase n=1 Tax=Deinococcus sp. TaxID=47478 RepID=UPI003B5C8319